MRFKLIFPFFLIISLFGFLTAFENEQGDKEDLKQEHLSNGLKIPYQESSFFRLSLLRPEIRNETYMFNLQEKPDEDRLITEEEYQEGSFSFALSSYTSFRESLRHFISDRQRSRSFLDYYVVNESISGRLQISLIAGMDYHTDFEEQYLHLYRGVQLRGNINNRLVFWGNWWAGRFQGDLDFAEGKAEGKKGSPLLLGFYKSHHTEASYTHLNMISGNISYLLDFGKVSVGRGAYLIGDNIGGSVILNNAVNDYGYFSAEVYFGKLRLSFLHASLIPDSLDIFSEFDNQDRFLVLHQLNYTPLPDLDFYFGEQIIYANRSIDPSYLLPHTFYRITEHKLQDRDNVLIYAGMRWTIRELVTLYGSLILDELRKSEIFGDWWGNKYAVQGGMSWSFAEGLLSEENRPLRATLELTAVRPWMYTHKAHLTPFSHDGRGLGFPGGSNIIQSAGEIAVPVKPYLELHQYVSFSKQGSLGNCFSINYDDRVSDTAKWLEGEKTDRWISRSVLTWSMLAHHRLRLGVEFTRENKESWQKGLVFGYQALY